MVLSESDSGLVMTGDPEGGDEAEIARERDEGLKRLMRMPPRLHKDEPKRSRKKAEGEKPRRGSRMKRKPLA